MARAVLSFPLTSFDSSGAVELAGFQAHVQSQIEAEPGAIFVCCGTGEFFSLSLDEYEQLVRAAVELADGRLPVIAGVGYGWALAAQFAQAAERAGADAGLLMPFYLISGPQMGIVQHVREVAQRTELPLIVYQRGQVKLSIESVQELAGVASIIGLKDGHGDLDQMQRLRLVAPQDWLFFNGAATAEMQARPYSSIGVPAYSSAIHAFAPEIAKSFFTVLQKGDDAAVEELLREFVLPLVELRDRGTGYAVSLVKAAARLRGAPVGSVRAPLVDPTAEHLRELEALLDKGLALAAR
jgi:5-dehydro-4-deoxyglucarate dehydratase